MDRKEILERAGSPEDKILAARLLDKLHSLNEAHGPVVADFYDPYQQNVLSSVLDKVPGISFLWTGGYEDSERKRLVIWPEHMDTGERDDQIQVLAVSGNLKFKKLTHRDYLGAILSMGIKREKIGDIIEVPDGCQVIADRLISGYITENLKKVNRLGVKVREIPLKELRPPVKNVKEITATVPSLRLDAVAAAGYGISRNKILGEITAEKVKVNWSVVSDGSFQVKEGDIISTRGRGRVRLETVRGLTKKGRVSVRLTRYR
ncbi:MAG: photosystem II S4 domain protein [Firmicutes bacterium HGW-Firmicutes-14]|nr:MAG: photosystem II S4 domain protein [Firmicutes bacterium HGW-Firmicutes-14]